MVELNLINNYVINIDGLKYQIKIDIVWLGFLKRPNEMLSVKKPTLNLMKKKQIKIKRIKQKRYAMERLNERQQE